MRSGDDFGHNLVSYLVAVNFSVLCKLIKGGIASDEDSGLISQCMGIGKGDEMPRYSRND